MGVNSVRGGVIWGGLCVVTALGVMGLSIVSPPLPNSSDGSTRSPAVEALSIEDLYEALSPCDGCLRLLYVKSPSMPWSELGIVEAEAAAEVLGIPLVVTTEEVVVSPSEGVYEGMRRGIVAADATVHYPAMLVMESRSAVGKAVVGYKPKDGYVRLMKPRIAAASPDQGGRGSLGVRDELNTGVVTGNAAANTTSDVDLVWSYEMTPRPGAFFRRVPGTSVVAYDQRRTVWLTDFETGDRYRGPGFIDFVPTPDAHLFVTPAQGHAGLEFYEVDRVLKDSRAGIRTDPIYVDKQMTDQYPSIGVMGRSDDGQVIRYRILMSWFEGLAYRDYEARTRRDGSVRVRPTSRKRPACPGMDLSTPILSKDGLALAARDETSGTTRLFAMDRDGSCSLLQDIGMPTSKVGFSDDGRLVAFSSPEDDGSSLTYVFDREAASTTVVPGSHSRGLVIPEFVGPDSLIYLAVDRTQPATAEFKMVCCVR